MSKCPRNDPNNLSTDDVFEVDCPGCGKSIEFFKDEVQNKCRGCGQVVPNPNKESTAN